MQDVLSTVFHSCLKFAQEKKEKLPRTHRNFFSCAHEKNEGRKTKDERLPGGRR